ncbi:hypothetical protein NE237_009616 [Protea cynaroides]|uniref:Uncharacterized protein n=1 Tax=Protea cynaroides TaxID=273540 RepID=A0A9Q0KY58_9MAGN|nr:hypothetical protein NE237_009616 [Protea cynaroides]
MGGEGARSHFSRSCYERDLVRLLGGAIAGILSLTDEHYGISVVEYMAAGAIPIDGVSQATLEPGFLRNDFIMISRCNPPDFFSYLQIRVGNFCT